MKFQIKTSRGYFSQVNRQNQVASFTPEEHRATYAKNFSTEKAAKTFADKLVGAGYGFPAEFEIVPA